MRMDEAERLRKTWRSKLCSHPTTVGEYYLGLYQGQVCNQCGQRVGPRTRLQRAGGLVYVAFSRLWSRGK